MTTTTAVSLDEFTERFTSILRETLEVDASSYSTQAYELIFAAPGTYVNPAGTKGVAKRLLVYIWSHFQHGEKSAIATQQVLQAVGLGSEVPKNWLQVYRDRG